MLNVTQEEITKNWNPEYTTPIVSIKCMAYNHEKYIVDALDGFLMQKTNFPFEVIVHDDASTDKTAEIIREYELKFPKIIKPIYEEENQFSKHDGSLGRVVNSMLRGKYIAICEGDDYWIDPLKLQKQIKFLEENEKFSACYSNVKGIDSDGNELKYVYKLYPYYKQHVIPKDNNLYMGLLGQTATCVIKSECLLEKILLLSDYQNVNGDVKISAISRASGDVYYFEEQFSAHRKVFTGDSWTAKNYKKNMSYMYYISSKDVFNFSRELLGKNYINEGEFLSQFIFSSLKKVMRIPTKENFSVLFKIWKDYKYKSFIAVYLIKMFFGKKIDRNYL